MKRFVLIGHPVGHSISPAIHAAAYRELGLLGHSYDAVDCPDEAAVAEQIRRIRSGEIAGANVTIPWKRVALELSDEAAPLASETGAANVLAPVLRDGLIRVVAHNTDADALASELAGARPDARRAVIIGSGGAALAALAACKRLGVHSTVTARKWRGDAASFPRAEEFRALGAATVAWPSSLSVSEPWAKAASQADLIVQSTSAGMKGAESGEGVRDIIPWDALAASVFVYDLVYNPPITPLLAACRTRNVDSAGGLGMLVGQAAKAVEIWLSIAAPREAMRAAAEHAVFPEALE